MQSMSTESMVRSPDSSGSSRPAGGGLRRSNGMPRWENEARHLLFQKGLCSHRASPLDSSFTLSIVDAGVVVL